MPSGATDLKMIFHRHFERRYSDMFHQNRHIQQVYVIVRQLFTSFNSNIKYIIHPYPELSRTQICQNISRDRRSRNQPCPKRPIYIRDHPQLNFFEQEKHKTSQTYQNTSKYIHISSKYQMTFSSHIFPQIFPTPAASVALRQDRAMLAELKSSWDAKSGLHAQRTEQRRKELLALQDAAVAT